MFSRGTRGPRATRLVLGASLTVVLSLVMSSCGGADYVFAGSQPDHVFFRVPSSWALYDTQQILTAERANGTAAAARFRWIAAYDADPNPDIDHVLISSSSIPQHPVIYAYVKALTPGASDQYSLLALRNDYFQVDVLANKGNADFISPPEDVRYPGGYFGQKSVYELFFSTITSLEVNEVAVTDQGFRHVYMLLIYCDSLCYHQNQGMIEEIARTWTLKEF